MSEPTLEIDPAASASTAVDAGATSTQQTVDAATATPTPVVETAPAPAVEAPAPVDQPTAVDQTTSTTADQVTTSAQPTTSEANATTNDAVAAPAPSSDDGGSSGGAGSAGTPTNDDTGGASGEVSPTQTVSSAHETATHTVDGAAAQASGTADGAAQASGTADGAVQVTGTTDGAAAGPVDGTVAIPDAAQPAGTATDTLQSVGDSGGSLTDSVPTVSDTLQRAAEPVGGSVTNVTDTLQSVGDPGGSLTDPVSTITDSFQRETDRIVNALPTVRDPLQTVDTLQGSTDPVQAITDPEVHRMGGTLDQATDPLQQTVGDPVGTVSGTVQQATGDPVQTVTQTVQQTTTDPVQTVTQAVQQTADDPVQTVGQTVQPVTGGTDPVSGATQSVTGTVHQAADAVQPATGAVGNVTQAGSSIVDASAATAGGAVETVAKHEGGALAGAGESVHSTAQQIAGGTPVSEKVTTVLTGTGAPAPTDVAPAIPSQMPEHITSGPTPGLTDGSQPVPGDDGGLLGGLPFHVPGAIPGGDEVLMATAAAITVASVAIAVRPSTVATAQFFLANVRDIPAACGGVRAGVNRQISAVAAGSAHVVEVAADAPHRAAAAVDDMSKAFGDGFRRALDGPLPGGLGGATDDGERDIRLLMQIGMLLGAVYVAFLTVWFWATRLRWNPRT